MRVVDFIRISQIATAADPLRARMAPSQKTARLLAAWITRLFPRENSADLLEFGATQFLSSGALQQAVTRGMARAGGEIPPSGDLGAYGFGLFQLAILTHWLQDRSENKEDTLAVLDRCLNISTSFIQKGGWEW